MSQVSNYTDLEAGDPEQARRALLMQIDGLETQTVEQYAFVAGMKYIATNNYTSAEAALDVIVELFPPDVLCSPSCLKLQLLYVIFRDVLQHVGLSVDRRRGLYMPEAIANALYQSDETMSNTASQFIADFKPRPRYRYRYTPTNEAELTNSGPGSRIERIWARQSFDLFPWLLIVLYFILILLSCILKS